jgi:hypothetical protein
VISRGRPRSVLRFENWTLAPDREPDAEPVTFAMQCAVCRQRSTATVNFAYAQSWAMRHAGRNPSHLTYRELITRPWQARMEG